MTPKVITKNHKKQISKVYDVDTEKISHQPLEGNLFNQAESRKNIRKASSSIFNFQ